MDFLYDVAVVAIIKNEGPYLAEWLDYHERAGIDHFFLYDNDSTDDTRQVLHPYVERGYVTYIPRPGTCQQLLAYGQALRDWRYICRYLAFIDADEYIFPVSGGSIPDIVHQLLDNQPHAGGLVINWRMFGTSGYQDASEYEGILNSFLHRAKDDFISHYTVKSIVNPRLAVYFENPHYALYYPGDYAIDETGKCVQRYFDDTNPCQYLVLNHYATKSRNEWLNRHSQPAADDARPVNDEEIFRNNDRNEVFDNAIVRYRNSRVQPHVDYLAEQKKYRIESIDRMAGILAEGGTKNYRLEEMLQSFYACGKVLEDYLSRQEQRTLRKRLADRILRKKDLSIEEAYLLIDSLPDISSTGDDFWSQHRGEIVDFVKRTSSVMNRYAVSSRERYIYDYLARLLRYFD